MEQKGKMYDITVYEVTKKANISVKEENDMMAQNLALELAKAGRLDFEPVTEEDHKYIRYVAVVWTPKEECKQSCESESCKCDEKCDHGKTIH